jgi:hypothetical protein
MEILILRFEGNLAVCLHETIGSFHLLRSNLPEDVNEWDVLKVYMDRFEFDFSATNERRDQAIQYLNGLDKTPI